MLSEKQVEEIRGHLEAAQNPLFFFDNDADGLCSFLLLQRFLGRGKGVPVRSFPALALNYFRKVRELNADYIFILDKPVVSDEFLKEVNQINLPVVWIDHHDVQAKIPEFVHYYNHLSDEDRSYWPTSASCYQVTQKKDDLWIAVAGCVSDNFLPEFYNDFRKQYPELAINSKVPFEVYYNSQIGKIVQIFNAALKDRTTNVINMLRFLMKVRSPHEVLEENSKTYFMHKRFSEINSRLQKLLEKAKKEVIVEGILFFRYGGDLSISSDLAGLLSYFFPDRILVIGYNSGNKINLSVRGDNIREVVLEVLGNLENATGGGHECAVGASIRTEDWEKFRELFIEGVKRRNNPVN